MKYRFAPNKITMFSDQVRQLHAGHRQGGHALPAPPEDHQGEPHVRYTDG